ncbi:MAG: methyltransferase domain-containing protein [bacterium]|nr:methyltransferase domain-containing protein [bacterium]
MFDYHTIKKEKVACNLCGKENYHILAGHSSDGLPADTCLCKHCGLIYLNPRMTKEGYDEYYKYFYREHRAQIKGKGSNVATYERGFDSAVRFGEAVGRSLQEYMLSEGATVDVGSHTGGILFGLKKIFPAIDMVGIEPSVEAASFANKRGIKTYNCLFEDFPRDKETNVSNILCMQTLNHLLDPKGFMIWAHETLIPGGRLILSVKNFRDQCRRGGSLASGIQIDHAYMFTPETVRRMVESAGFTVLYEDADEYKTDEELMKQKKSGLSWHHIRIVGKKNEGNNVLPLVPHPEIVPLLRRQLSRWNIVFYYLLFYSRRTAWFRKLFAIKK